MVSFLKISKRYVTILILVVKEHDVGIDDINEAPGNIVIKDVSTLLLIFHTVVTQENLTFAAIFQ